MMGGPVDLYPDDIGFDPADAAVFVKDLREAALLVSTSVIAAAKEEARRLRGMANMLDTFDALDRHEAGPLRRIARAVADSNIPPADSADCSRRLVLIASLLDPPPPPDDGGLTIVGPPDDDDDGGPDVDGPGDSAAAARRKKKDPRGK